MSGHVGRLDHVADAPVELDENLGHRLLLVLAGVDLVLRQQVQHAVRLAQLGQDGQLALQVAGRLLQVGDERVVGAHHLVAFVLTGLALGFCVNSKKNREEKKRQFNELFGGRSRKHAQKYRQLPLTK